MANNAWSVANEFIRLALEDGQPLTNMKLHKLMYFAQGHAYGIYGKPLIDEEPEAWRHGPVFPSVYREFKRHGSGEITDFACDPFDDEPWEFQGTEKDRELIQAVWGAYKRYSAIRLSQMSHEPNGPWSKAYVPGANALITPRMMLDYFQPRASVPAPQMPAQ